MDENKKKNIINLILSGDFENAKKAVEEFSYKELDDLLMIMGFDYGQSLIVYSFVCYLIKCNEDIKYHFLAQSVLCGPLCHIEGAYETALYHNKTILNIEDNNIRAKEMMLFYNMLPTPLVGDEEALLLAKDILKQEPDNVVAQRHLKEFS